MALEHLPQRPPQDVHAVPVNYSHPGHFGQQGIVEQLVYGLLRFLGGLADHVDFGQLLRFPRGMLNGDAGGKSARCVRGRQNFGDIVRRHPELQRAGLHFEAAVRQFPRHASDRA